MQIKTYQFSGKTLKSIYKDKVNFKSPSLNLKVANQDIQEIPSTNQICSKIIEHINSKDFDSEYKKIKIFRT